MGAVRSAGEFSRTRRTRLNWHGLYSLWRSCHLGPCRKVNGRADANADADTNSDTYTDADTNSYAYTDAYTDAFGW